MKAFRLQASKDLRVEDVDGDRRNWSHLCDNRSVVDLSYLWGRRADRCLVYDYNVAKLSPKVSDEQGAMIEPAAAPVNATGKSDLCAGKTILMIGGETIGALVALAASAAGTSNAPNLKEGNARDI